MTEKLWNLWKRYWPCDLALWSTVGVNKLVTQSLFNISYCNKLKSKIAGEFERSIAVQVPIHNVLGESKS
jgi:hypothetical protein